MKRRGGRRGTVGRRRGTGLVVDLVLLLAIVKLHARCQRLLQHVRGGAEETELKVFATLRDGRTEKLACLANDEGIAFLESEGNGCSGYGSSSGVAEPVLGYCNLSEVVNHLLSAFTDASERGESRGDEHRALRDAESLVFAALALLCSQEHSRGRDAFQEAIRSKKCADGDVGEKGDSRGGREANVRLDVRPLSEKGCRLFGGGDTEFARNLADGVLNEIVSRCDAASTKRNASKCVCGDVRLQCTLAESALTLGGQPGKR